MDEVERMTEREAIVKWLREEAARPDVLDGEIWVLHAAADAIERGEHMREDG